MSLFYLYKGPDGPSLSLKEWTPRKTHIHAALFVWIESNKRFRQLRDRSFRESQKTHYMEQKKCSMYIVERKTHSWKTYSNNQRKTLIRVHQTCCLIWWELPLWVSSKEVSWLISDNLVQLLIYATLCNWSCKARAKFEDTQHFSGEETFTFVFKFPPRSRVIFPHVLHHKGKITIPWPRKSRSRAILDVSLPFCNKSWCACPWAVHEKSCRSLSHVIIEQVVDRN